MWCAFDSTVVFLQYIIENKNAYDDFYFSWSPAMDIILPGQKTVVTILITDLIKSIKRGSNCTPVWDLVLASLFVPISCFIGGKRVEAGFHVKSPAIILLTLYAPRNAQTTIQMTLNAPQSCFRAAAATITLFLKYMWKNVWRFLDVHPWQDPRFTVPVSPSSRAVDGGGNCPGAARSRSMSWHVF